MRVPAILLCTLALAACGGDDPAKPDDPAASVPIPPDAKEITFNPVFKPGPIKFDAISQSYYVNDKRFEAALIDAVKNYAEAYGNIDDLMRWAPGMCRVPTIKIRESASDNVATHGRKLYWLYAKDRDAYLKVAKGGEQPIGQVIVKEAFAAEPGKAGGDPQKLGHQPLVTTIERDGKPYHAGAKQALYVMLKQDPKTEGTDEGWVYGTLTPDGKTVTSAGRVASCMKCHIKNTSDRMFGLPAR